MDRIIELKNKSRTNIVSQSQSKSIVADFFAGNEVCSFPMLRQIMLIKILPHNTQDVLCLPFKTESRLVNGY